MFRLLSLISKSKPHNKISLENLTVLVGPNNSGKSQVLRDVIGQVKGLESKDLKVLGEVIFSPPSLEEIKSSVRELRQSSGSVNYVSVSESLQSSASLSTSDNYFSIVSNGAEINSDNLPSVLKHFGSTLLAHLNAEARFALTRVSDAYNPREEHPSNALQSLVTSSPEVQAELREVFKSAFQMDIGLDWAAMTRLYLRIKKDFGEIPDNKTGLDRLMRDAEELEKQGDGYRSFAGIVLALLTYPDRAVMLDEPEAFLHPAQARALGRFVARNSARRSGQIIVATHSSDFLFGLIDSSEPVKIIRLNRAGNFTDLHEVPSAVSSELVRSPFLTSQPVLTALFGSGVVVCEGDPDRAIYQAVSQLINQGDESIFIHSNGKDSAKIPLGLLRAAGVPACVILDFDAFSSRKTLDEIMLALTGEVLSDDLVALRSAVAAGVEEREESESLQELVNAVVDWMILDDEDLRSARRSLVKAARAGSNKWDQAKRVGTEMLSDEKRDQANYLIDALAGVGLFVVHCGELESWMSLGKKKGSGWNQAALLALRNGECPVALRKFVEDALKYLGRRAQEIAEGEAIAV